MHVSLDKLTNEVKGINLSPNPLTLNIEVKENFTLSKSITEVNPEKPIIQKVNENGEELYKDNVIDEFTFNEVHYPDGKKPIKFEDKEVTNTWTDEEGVEHSQTVTVQVPVEWEDLEPVMIDNYHTITVTLKERPSAFTLEEVLTEKYSELLESSLKDCILADMFLNEEDIDIEDENHNANTGAMILELNPQGQAKTKTIALEKQATEFELLEFNCPDGVDVYLSGKKFVDGKLTLTSPVSNCTIKFVNTTDKKITVNSYAIGY